MQVSARTLDDLGFPEVLRALAARARTDMGKERALARPFFDTPAEVRDALDRAGEARSLQESQLSLPLGNVPDIRAAIERAAKGAMLEPKELLGVAALLLAADRARELLEDRRSTYPKLSSIADRLPDDMKLAQRLEKSFEASGDLSDWASPALHEAREKARGLHRGIKAKLDRMLRDEKFVSTLRESYYSIRNDRYVVPVVAQHRAQVPGIVHNASQSGQTLFVEPEDLIGLGNDLAIALSLVLEEERRILLELSGLVGAKASALFGGIAAIAELDEIEAVARLSSDLKCATPEVEGIDGPLRLRDLRHPLLTLRGVEVVPNELDLGGERRALVVSGPNAGGKTITLTAVGLSALMVRAGIPVPAASGSAVPLYRSVHAAVGDAQDLSRGLSTFSAHVVQLRDITEVAGHGSLVLIDEIAADTDPREGAAIAIAVLEELLGRGVTVLVTTHLEELKALAHMDTRFLNARVGFDPSKMAPTYKLQLGQAGSSSAIEIARRMGLPDRLCERAKELALHAGGPLSKALAAAEEERRLAYAEREKARLAAAEAEAQRAKLERERRELEGRRADELARHRAALVEELERTRVELKELLASLRAKPDVKRASAAHAELVERAEKIQESQAAPEPRVQGEVRPGALAMHLKLKKKVEVVEITGDEALVVAGTMKMRVPLTELAPAQGAKPKPKFSEREDKAAKLRPGEIETSSSRCDLRGKRAEEALREVELFLDAAYQRGDDAAVIVHGHGTGALKQVIREYLERSPYVSGHRSGESHEGGDGVTVVTFRS